MLYGLSFIDFEGLCGLAGDISRSDMFNTFRTGLPDGFIYKVSDDEINEILNGVYGKYRVTSDQVNVDQSTRDAIESDVRSMVDNVLSRVSGRFAAYSLNILGIVKNLQAQGIAVVPKQTQAAPTQGRSPSPPMAWTPLPTQPQPVMGPDTTMQQTSPQGAIQYQVVRGKRVPVRGKSLVQNKSKLYWIMGIGGAVLVIAIALIASKSGD